MTPTAGLAWIAHLYTALGAGTALGATLAVFAGEFRQAFLWLALAVFIDSTDGVLARSVNVKERLPWFDGATLDNIVDYLTYVFVPVLIMLRAGLLPASVATWLGVAVLVASGYGFSRSDAKVATTDYFFMGFPSVLERPRRLLGGVAVRAVDQRRHRRGLRRAGVRADRLRLSIAHEDVAHRHAVPWNHLGGVFHDGDLAPAGSGRPVDASFAGVPGLLPPAVGPTQRC